MSLDESEPVDSALTFPCGYDTLEYSGVKAYDDIHVLADLSFVKLRNVNKLSGAVVGEW